MESKNSPLQRLKQDACYIVIGFLLLIITVVALILLNRAGVFQRLSFKYAIIFPSGLLAAAIIGFIPLVISLTFLLTGIVLAYLDLRNYESKEHPSTRGDSSIGEK